ncbi:uncharacterized protein LTR77_004572 [Saxophila tyrrhenica]|uniref:Shugoshin n=1 Tax=Saxophila tyrrhenica TaxID=1690608 RepID=A0AAV9PH22_9PEZI|nr:hypothetical protein LTR77_004572 [Saxophila tyrrhenica]
MARLNEPPAAPASTSATAPGESVDALKRRFIRQNRELAKNNSSQSLRIRNLELEVSRLLSDNLDLRNQVLHLQNEVYTAQTRASQNAAQTLKDEMRAKMAELACIVDGIDEAQEVELPDALRRKRPVEGNWRERQPLSELMRETQMPTITEDKSYPRRTLGTDEIQAIRLSDHSSNESPDLGPPPVARFDYEDPVKNASPLGNKTSPEQPAVPCEKDVLPANLTVNLETRRKRKDGSSRLEIKRHSLLPQSPVKSEEGQPASTILRTGAKRKLADRENDKPIKPPSKGDFTFSRKTLSEDARPTMQKPASAEQVEEVAQASPKPTRRVLGDKSVNMSPRKPASRADKPEKDGPEKEVSFKPKAGKDAAPGRRRRASSIPLPSPPRDSIAETVEILPPPPPALAEEPNPKTPAALDLFSPTPSEPSAKPQGRGDTPPPSDLTTLSVTTDGGEVRPSRRARSAVNYAEPSLISKMRRPDKKMVDALTGLQDPRRAMNASDRKAPMSASRMVEIKQEPVDEDENNQENAWKDLPSASAPLSPLHQKSDTLDDNPIQHSPPLDLNRAHSAPEPAVLTNVTSDPDQPRSATSATISALMAGSRKRRQSSQQPFATDIQPPSVEEAVKKLEELDLYEFKDSSSPNSPEKAESAAREVKPASRARATGGRRHSSVPKNDFPATGSSRARSRAEAAVNGNNCEGETGTETLDAAAGARMRRRRSMMV